MKHEHWATLSVLRIMWMCKCNVCKSSFWRRTFLSYPINILIWWWIFITKVWKSTQMKTTLIVMNCYSKSKMYTISMQFLQFVIHHLISIDDCIYLPIYKINGNCVQIRIAVIAWNECKRLCMRHCSVCIANLFTMDFIHIYNIIMLHYNI